MSQDNQIKNGIKASDPKAAKPAVPQRRGRGGPGMGPPGMMSGEKPKDFKKTFAKLLRYLDTYKVALLIVLLFSAGSTVLAIIGPKVLAQATNKLFEGIMGKMADAGSKIDFVYIGRIIVQLIMLYLSSAVFSYIQGFIMSGISMKISYRLRREISGKIGRMPLRYFDNQTHGDVLSRVTNDVDMVSNTLNQSLPQLISSLTMIVGTLVMMLSISWQMTLAAMLVLPVSSGLIMTVVRRSQKYFTRQQATLGEVNGHVEEMYGGHMVMKAYNGEAASIQRFNGLNEKLFTTAWKSQFLSGMMFPLMGFIGNLGYVVVCIIGGILAIQKAITVGDIQAFIQYVRMFTQPVGQMATVANVLQSTLAASERVFTFLEEDEEAPDSSTPASPENIQGQVSFEHVHFGYNPEKIIINDFSVDVKPGQKVAIVGPTGAGKTTMVKLLMRFYDVSGGVIKIDDIDIRDFTRSGLRSLFGMVLQDTWLFNGTIRDNIRYGRPEASMDEVKAAASAAYADHFIHTLPNGYDMVLNEEASNISQGQKQLLTIARAFLVDPKILILDEATSSVDTRTEIIIQQAMQRLMQGRTSFIIAHRLSTIRDADLILVMHDGDIVEQGTHIQLLADNGYYASLYYSQFETTEN